MITRIRAFLRSLQVDLAEREAAIAVGRWRLLTHADELIHDRHCPLTGYEPGDPARCECGWAEASPALEVLSDLAERVDGFGRATPLAAVVGRTHEPVSGGDASTSAATAAGSDHRIG